MDTKAQVHWTRISCELRDVWREMAALAVNVNQGAVSTGQVAEAMSAATALQCAASRLFGLLGKCAVDEEIRGGMVVLPGVDDED